MGICVRSLLLKIFLLLLFVQSTSSHHTKYDDPLFISAFLTITPMHTQGALALCSSYPILSHPIPPSRIKTNLNK